MHKFHFWLQQPPPPKPNPHTPPPLPPKLYSRRNKPMKTHTEQLLFARTKHTGVETNQAKCFSPGYNIVFPFARWPTYLPETNQAACLSLISIIARPLANSNSPSNVLLFYFTTYWPSTQSNRFITCYISFFFPTAASPSFSFVWHENSKKQFQSLISLQSYSVVHPFLK